MRDTTRPWGGTLPTTPPRGTICGGYRTNDDDEPNERPADNRPPGHPKQPPPPPAPPPTLLLPLLLLAAGWWGGRLGNRHDLPGDHQHQGEGRNLADWEQGADSETARRRGQPPRDNQGDKK